METDEKRLNKCAPGLSAFREEYVDKSVLSDIVLTRKDIRTHFRSLCRGTLLDWRTANVTSFEQLRYTLNRNWTNQSRVDEADSPLSPCQTGIVDKGKHGTDYRRGGAGSVDQVEAAIDCHNIWIQFSEKSLYARIVSNGERSQFTPFAEMSCQNIDSSAYRAPPKSYSNCSVPGNHASSRSCSFGWMNRCL